MKLICPDALECFQSYVVPPYVSTQLNLANDLYTDPTSSSLQVLGIEEASLLIFHHGNSPNR